MPLYEYECESCGHRFEVIQKYSDAPISVCPKCSGPVRKLFSSPAIQFKGSGFYITDYARAGKAGSDGSSPAEKGESSGKSTDSKPAAAESKTDAKTETKSSASESKADTKADGGSKGSSKSSASKPASD